MIKRLIEYFSKESKENRKLASVMKDFVAFNNPYNSLSLENSKENLKEGIVEIVENGVHDSNGLLLTDDGYILTAAHCVEEGLNVELAYNGERYPLELCIADETFDVAIAKAPLQGDCVPRRYKLSSRFCCEKDFPVTALARWDGELKAKLGNTLVSEEAEKKGLILHTAQATHGFSGGPLVNLNSELIGISKAIVNSRNVTEYILKENGRNSLKIYVATASHIFNALELVNLYRDYLRS